MSEESVIYIDASGHILGRLASIVAKKLLEGYNVYVVNVEKAVLSGDKQRVIQGYKLLFRVRTHVNPEKPGIRRPRSPVSIFRRAVRGMLPMDKPRGRLAYKRLRVFIGIPPELSNVEFTKYPSAMYTRLRGRYITVEELSRELGWRGVAK
ncbi:MAG: 50S ribosomal protein L13 [Desulfurococcaceae archaeon]|jgi:large subunit ribosomal protein L13|nr:50S ribosomal protein L13 [Desulfurococcaceae archaeon]